MGQSSTGGSFGGWDLGKSNAPVELATEDKDKSAGKSAVTDGGWGSSKFDNPDKSTVEDKAKKSASGSLTTGGGLGLGNLDGPRESSAMEVPLELTTKAVEQGTTDENFDPAVSSWEIHLTPDPAQTAANESSMYGIAELSDTLGLGKSSPALDPKLLSPKPAIGDPFPSEPMSNLPVSSGNEGPLNHTELGTSTSNKPLPPKITLEPSEPVDQVDDTHPTSKSTPGTPAGADAGAAEGTEDKDENVGPDGKPLTAKQKKKRKEKEAKEKADREEQEQLERELAEDANAFVIAGESGDGDWNMVNLDGKKKPAKDGDAGEDKNDDEDEWPSGKKDKKGSKGKKGKDDEEGGDEANGKQKGKKGKKGKK